MLTFSLLQYWKLVFSYCQKVGTRKIYHSRKLRLLRMISSFRLQTSFRLMGNLATQVGLSPLIDGSERCSRNWSDWKQKAEGNSETQIHVFWFMIKSIPVPTEHRTNLLGKPPSFDWLVSQPTLFVRFPLYWIINWSFSNFIFLFILIYYRFVF